MLQKLGRRQRAFEVLIQSTENGASDRLDKYRTILSREFTSSDEEVDVEERTGGSALGNGATADEDEQHPLLRVRNLKWQSEEVRVFKERLDAIYQERFATEKQRLHLLRLRRDGAAVSRRLRPRFAPDWAVNNCME